MSTRKPSSGRLRSKKRNLNDPNQTEFVIIWRTLLKYPFRLRAGDVIRLSGRLCYVVRVNDCAAVVIMNRPVRVFTTRFDRPVRFQPKPITFRISPQSDIPILNGKVK
jgi:hypothetical protein